MSVRDRIEDSKLLFAAGRLEGALLSVLIAVAGTARKRYPSQTDREGFERFLRDENSLTTGGVDLKISFEGRDRTFENILYKFVRCHLVHEGELAERVSFDYGDFLIDKRGTTDFFTFSSELVLRLAFIVEKAPENKGIFPEDTYDRLPDPVDLTRVAFLEYQWGEQSFELACSACSVRTEIWEDSGEPIVWVHCKGSQIFNGQLPDGKATSRKFLIPANYVTSLKPGPVFKVSKRRGSPDIGIFPPTQPVPEGQMLLSEIEKVIAELQIPLVETVIAVRRPHYDLDNSRSSEQH